MARKREKVPKTGAVWHMSAEEATLAKMPRYDAWACGHGPHGQAGYERAKEKRAWQKQMRQEGAQTGSFLFARVPLCGMPPLAAVLFTRTSESLHPPPCRKRYP